MTTPNSDIDTLAQRVTKLEDALVKNEKEDGELRGQLHKLEKLFEQTLAVFRRSQQVQDLNVSRTVYRILDGFVHSLGDAIQVSQKQFEDIDRGFIVRVIDGVDEVGNDLSMIANYQQEDFFVSSINDPMTSRNENNQALVKYLLSHEFAQQIENKQPVMINVYMIKENQNGAQPTT